MNFVKRFISWYNRPKSQWEDLLEFIFIFLPLIFLIRTIGFGHYRVPTCSMETTMLAGEHFIADKFTPLFGRLKHGDVISFNSPLFDYSQNPLVNMFQMYVWGPENWTKRIIGVPGDHIKGTIEDGKPVVYRNDKKLEEPYLNQYPIILTVNPQRSFPSPIVHKTYVPDVPLNKQPFYRINPQELKLGKIYAQRTGEPFLRYPGTPNLNTGMSGDRIGKIYDEYDIQLGPDEYWMMGDNRQGSSDSRAWGPLKAKFIHGKILFRIWSQDNADESWIILDLLKHPIDYWCRVRWSRCLNVIR